LTLVRRRVDGEAGLKSLMAIPQADALESEHARVNCVDHKIVQAILDQAKYSLRANEKLRYYGHLVPGNSAERN
jgi:hypothetical protein